MGIIYMQPFATGPSHADTITYINRTLPYLPTDNIDGVIQ